jgi:Tol biopolymer transport system component
MCAGVSACGGGTTASPVEGRIAFLEATGPLQYGVGDHLVVMRVDGSQRRVLDATYAEGDPVWSPDGRRVAFFGLLDTNAEHTFIDVVDADGSHLRRLTPRTWLEDCSWPVWTRDSKTVAFTRNLGCDGDMGIYTARPDGSRLKALFKSNLNGPGASNPAWSPDGRTVSYIGKFGLTLMNANGSNPHPLAAADVAYPGGYPSPPPTIWSPSGSRIYYLDAGEGLSVINRDGTHRHRVVKPTREGKPGEAVRRVLNFSLSPDGKLIAFFAGDGKNKNLYVSHADGSHLKKLEDNSGDPTWSPDGKWIAFDGAPKSTKFSQIWIVNPDGHNLRDLSNDASDDSSPAWARVAR